MNSFLICEDEIKDDFFDLISSILEGKAIGLKDPDYFDHGKNWGKIDDEAYLDIPWSSFVLGAKRKEINKNEILIGNSPLIELVNYKTDINKKYDFFIFNFKNNDSCNKYSQLKKENLIKYGLGFDEEPLINYDNLNQFSEYVEKGIEKVINLGLESYITKPFDPDRDFIPEIISLNEISNNFFRNQGFTVLGPSGIGKNTLIENLLQYHKRAGLCTKLTTRPLRKTDKKIKQITEKEFMKLFKKNKLVGFHEYDNNFYGYLRDEIELYQKTGMDIFIDTVVPEVAISLKKEFPNFFKTITLEKTDQRVVNNLVNRFEKFDQQNLYLIYLKNSLNNRINHLMKKDKDYKKMIEIADFVLEDDHFGFKNNEFRRYLNYSRKGSVHPKRIKLTRHYKNLH